MSKKVKIFALVVIGLAAVIGGFSFFSGGAKPDTSGAMPTMQGTGAPAASSGLSTSAVPATPGAGAGMPLPGGPMMMPTAGETSMAANEFSGLLMSVNSISIDTSIFQNPAYKTLRDYPVLLGTDVVGRPNPFAPIGNDAGASGGGSTIGGTGTTGGITPVTPVSVQTLAPGKITTTGAELGASVTLPDTTPSTVVFQYGPTDMFGTATTPMTLTKTGTALSAVTGLKAGTKYFVQAVVVRGSNTTIGNVMTFTTLGTAPATTQ